MPWRRIAVANQHTHTHTTMSTGQCTLNVSLRDSDRTQRVAPAIEGGWKKRAVKAAKDGNRMASGWTNGRRADESSGRLRCPHPWRWTKRYNTNGIAQANYSTSRAYPDVGPLVNVDTGHPLVLGFGHDVVPHDLEEAKATNWAYRRIASTNKHPISVR